MPDSPNDLVTVNRLGVPVTVRRSELAERAQVGEAEVTPSRLAGAQADQAQRSALDSWDEKVGTFVEGAVDAISQGFFKDRSDEADVRRDVNSGSALTGALTGAVVSMKLPGVRSLVAKAGEVGEEVAGAAGLGRLATKGLSEASVAATLTSAAAVGHQAFDSLIEDKEFSMEAVAKETGLSALLGFGLGVLGGGLGKATGRGGEATTKSVTAQGGFVDPSSPEFNGAIDHVATAIRSMDEALDTHSARLEGLRVIHKEGDFNLEPALMEAREKAMEAAVHARAQLPDNVVESMKKADPALSKAVDDYDDALNHLDGVMRPRVQEGMRLQKGFGERIADPEQYLADKHAEWKKGGSFFDNIYGDKEVPMMNLGVNANMEGIPGAKDAYERIYGRPWEPVPEGPSIEESLGMAPEGARGPVEGSAPPEAGTAVKGRRAPATPEANAADALDAFSTNASPMPDGMKFPGGPTDTATELASRTPRPLTPGDPSDALNGAYRQGELSLFADGHMAPSVDIKQNAEAFRAFQDKMGAEDTLARKARKAASWRKEVPAEPAIPEVGSPPEASTNALKRGRGPDYRDTEVAGLSPKEAQARFAQSQLDDRMAASLKEPALPMDHAVDAAHADDLARLNEFIGLGDEPAPTPAPAPAKGLNSHGALIQDWFEQTKLMGPRVTPGELAANRIQQAADALYGATEGRADSVSALDFGEALGFHKARGSLATRIQQVQLLPKVAEHVAALSKAAASEGGVAAETVSAGKSKFSNWAKRKIGGSLGAKAGLVAGPIGGIVGYQLGAEAMSNYTGAAVKMAQASGRAATRCAQVAEKLLSGRRGAAFSSVASQKAYAYSPDGPIADPVQRILEVQKLAANPEPIREMVRHQMGDLAVIHPGAAQLLEDHAVNQVVQISMKAPRITFDRLGRPTPPSAGEMREFLTFEAAVHDIDGTLARIGKGSASDTEVEAMHMAAPKHMERVVRGVLADPDRLAGLPKSQLRLLESMTGVPLTERTSTQFLGQQAYQWQQAQAQQQPNGKPGALKPSASGLATPGQGAPSGRAPGN